MPPKEDIDIICTRSEMDIIPVFGTVVGGSNPSGCTRFGNSQFLDIISKQCGYGLVVECVLAKDETGVRFSLPAQPVLYSRLFIFDRPSQVYFVENCG